ncbi:hypothetical protein F443_02468 [Phytophthora nicotianae P1569]|uniref:Uncharacterized protein n=2 Tax=Phytophthora nicotianae TaxID=4792 RepID=V9FVG3_PHYNI|nr:hypothetical protein F443_02468 [Phytophthora nicotianae P1569]ETO83536.1 hypothetical protein F444_02451 [Phytophthora nicotianae P1976]
MSIHSDDCVIFTDDDVITDAPSSTTSLRTGSEDDIVDSPTSSPFGAATGGSTTAGIAPTPVTGSDSADISGSHSMTESHIVIATSIIIVILLS